MEIKTKNINIYKKGTIPFKIKISWTYFKGKLLLVEGGYMDFKKSFIRGFGDLFFDGESFDFLFEEENEVRKPTELYRNYQEIKNNYFRKPKEWSFEEGKKQSERAKERYKKKRAEETQAKEEINKMIKWL